VQLELGLATVALVSLSDSTEKVGLTIVVIMIIGNIFLSAGLTKLWTIVNAL
jgi:hypothetical protein